MQLQMMTQDILDRALGSKHGIALTLDSSYMARHYRRRLYAERERLRQAGNRAYDALSFIIRKGRELWVVRKNAPAPVAMVLQGCRELMQQELPRQILSRGKSRVGKNIYIS